MKISGFEKLTLTDYPGHMAAIIFTQGCNYRCPFCQNSPLLGNQDGLFDENEIMSYLKKRKNILEGLVISGGEPTLQKNLKGFIRKVRELGLKIKLDTNGYQFKVLDELLSEGLVDYVAMDVKNVFDSYDTICGVKINTDTIKKSIELLKKSKIDYEFRTTIVKEFHDINKILELCNLLKGSSYYLQNFRDSENVLKKNLHGFSEEELEEIRRQIKDYTNVKIRG